MLESRSLQKLYDQIKNSSSNLSVDIAEGGQTVKMIRDAIQFRKQFVSFCAQVVTQRGYRLIGKRRQAQRRLDYVNQKWLEARYGWQPFLSSIHGVADTIRKARVAGPVHIVCRTSNRKSETFTAGTGSFLDHKVLKKIDGSYRLERGAYYEAPGLQFTDFFSLNPLAIAWELVPYSFVVDWFVGIGQCLDNWETYAKARSSYKGGYLTYTTLETRIGREWGRTSYPAIIDTVQNTDGSYRAAIRDGTGGYDSYDCIGQCLYKYKERNPVNSLPLPYGPQVKLALGSKQIIDAAALMRQKLIKF
jgi:hypothetical protein